jgi:iron complex transport system permease protein
VKTNTFFVTHFALFALLLFANILWGSLSIPIDATWHILCGEAVEGHPSWSAIIWEGRVPQAVTAALCGASLSCCGLLLQTLFRNPLAGPSILGIDSGANLGVALVMLTGTGIFLHASTFVLVVTAAMTGALVTMMLLLVMNRVLRNDIMLLITGVIISSVTGSLIQLLNFSATEEGVHNFIIWGMGNFSAVSMDRLPLFVVLSVCGLLGATLLVKPLDTLLLGETYATNLGTNVNRVRTTLLIVTGLLTATTVAFCGPVSFLGLAVPHIARLALRSSSHRILLPATMLVGACLTLLCNLVSTLPTSVGVIPINVLTPIIGAPVILYVIFRHNNIAS